MRASSDQNVRKLVCPADSKLLDVGIGYKTLASDLMQFEQINALPELLKSYRFDEGSGIEAAFASHNAKLHKSCRVKYSSHQFERMKMNVTSADSQDDMNVNNSDYDDNPYVRQSS